MWKKVPKLIQKLKSKALWWIFNRYYGNFLYPFASGDDVWMSKSEMERWRLYQQVDDWVKSDAYKIEYENFVREFYQKLALESQSEEQVAGYRLTLLALKSWDVRLKGLAEQFKQIKIVEQTNKRI